MLSSIKLRFGFNPDDTGLEFVPTPMNVFVGPNNSGKSLVLRELYGSVANGSLGKILKAVEATAMAEAEIDQFITEQYAHHRLTLPEQMQWVPLGRMRPFSDWTGDDSSVKYETVKRGDPAARSAIIRARLKANVVALFPENRLVLLQDHEASDLNEPRMNLPLVALLLDHNARVNIRAVTADAFNKYFVVDPTGMTLLRVRLAERAPTSNDEELSIGESGRAFHSKATLLSQFSSGVKAFTGVVAALYASSSRMFVLDEADSFLHPPLASKLASIITSTMAERQGYAFAATHSPDFLMGCLQTGRPVNVIRLTYLNGVPTARLLGGDVLRDLMREPLLRNIGVLSAMFHVGAVVCEAPSDRVFYEELNFRLRSMGEGARDTVFLNAISKQTIYRIIAPLRKLGIPAAAVVDLDIIKEGDLRPLLKAACVPAPLIEGFDKLRVSLKDEFRRLERDPKEAGIYALPSDLLETAQHFLVNVAEYGVFVVPVGELERWFAHLNVRGEKNAWLIRLLERIGKEPNDPDYLHPQVGDAWDFVRGIAEWINNPRRKGTS